MLQINIFNPPGDPEAEITGVTVTASGSGHDVNDLVPSGVKLYWDKDRDGRLTTEGTTPDELLGSGDYSGDNGTIAFSGFVVPLPSHGNVDLLVLYTFSETATAGKTFRARVVSNSDFTIRDPGTLAPYSVTGAQVTGFLRTVGAGTLTIVRIAQNPDGAVAIPNRTRLPIINLQLIANDVEPITINSFDFLDIDTAHAVNGIVPGSVRLFEQAGVPGSSATPIATGTFAADNGRVTLTPSTPLSVPRNGSTKIWVTIDLVGHTQETIGNKYQIQVPTTTPMDAAGATSTAPVNFIGLGANGPEWTFNYNPILFSSPNDLGAILMPASAQRYPMLTMQLRNDPDARSEIATATQFTFRVDGTMNDASAISLVELFLDTSPYGKYSDNDVLLGSGTLTGDNGSATIDFSGSPQVLSISGTKRFLATINLTGTAADGQTARFSLLSRDDMVVTGAISMVNGSLIPSPFVGAIKTVGQPRAEFALETSQDRIPSIVAPNAADFPLLGWRIRNGNDEDLLFKGVQFDITGPLNEIGYFNKFELWHDKDGDGVQEADDFQIGGDIAVTPNGADVIVQISVDDDQAFLIPRGQEKRFTLYADISNSVIGDGSETFSIAADADTDVIAVGAGSGAVFSFSTVAPPFDAARTIRNPVISITHYPGPTSVSGCINGSYGFVVSRFSVPAAEDLLIQRVRFSTSGTLDDAAFIDDGYVWNDRNRNLLIDSSEVSVPFGIHVDPSPVASDNGDGLVDLGATPGLVVRNKTFDLGLGLGFRAVDPGTAQAQRDKTITVSQIGNMIIEGVGARSGRPITVDNPVQNDQGRSITFSVGTLTVSLKNIERTSGPPNGERLETFAILLKTSILEDVRLDTFTLTPIGSIDESQHIRAGGVKIYIDDNKNGKIDNNDYLYATADPPAFDNGPITFKASDYVFGNTVYSFPPGGRAYDQFIIAVDLKPSAPEGATLQFAIQNAEDIAATGNCSLFPYNLNVEQTYSPDAPPLIGPAILVERGAIYIQTDGTFANDIDNTPEVIMAPGATAYEVARLDLKGTPSEMVELRGITISASGTADDLFDLAALGVHLYHGAVHANNLITSGTFTMDNGTVTLTNFRQEVFLDKNAARDFRIAFTGSGSAQFDSTINMTIHGLQLDAVGMSSNLPVTKIIPEDPYVAIPIRFGTGKLYVRAVDKDGYVLPIPTLEPAKIQRLRFSASRTEDIRIEDLPVRAAGTANEPLILDSGAVLMNRRIGGNPPELVGSAPILPGNDGMADLRNLDILIEADKNTSTKYSLDVVMNPNTAVLGTTLRLDIESTSTIRAVGLWTGIDLPIVLEDYAGDDSDDGVARISGRNMMLSTGLVKLRKGNNNPPNRTIAGVDQKLTLLQVRVDVERDLEAVTISDVRICASGSCDETQSISNVYLYRDVDEDGLATAADQLLATSTFDSNNGTAHFSGLQLTYGANSYVYWLVAADLTGFATDGQTITANFCAENPISGVGQLTTGPIVVSVINPMPVGAVYTIGEAEPTPTPLPRNAVQSWEVYQ